jgi:hypothetical protein
MNFVTRCICSSWLSILLVIVLKATFSTRLRSARVSSPRRLSDRRSPFHDLLDRNRSSSPAAIRSTSNAMAPWLECCPSTGSVVRSSCIPGMGHSSQSRHISSTNLKAKRMGSPILFFYPLQVLILIPRPIIVHHVIILIIVQTADTLAKQGGL